MWYIARPSIFTRLAVFSLTVITQAFAGHLSDHNLTAISIVTTVIIGITFGFLCQLKTAVIAWVSGLALALHVFVSWLFVYKLRVSIVGIAIILDFSWWVSVLGLFCYMGCDGCPHSWIGFSKQAFVGLWDFFKLSVACGVMLSYVLSISLNEFDFEFELEIYLLFFRLENFYYRVLIIISGNMNNAEVALDALSIWVYVGNLSGAVDDLALETLFSEQGKVMEAKVVCDRDSGRSRGFEFVTCGSSDEVNNAIESLDGVVNPSKHG